MRIRVDKKMDTLAEPVPQSNKRMVRIRTIMKIPKWTSTAIQYRRCTNRGGRDDRSRDDPAAAATAACVAAAVLEAAAPSAARAVTRL
jgi:hypothetical protein